MNKSFSLRKVTRILGITFLILLLILIYLSLTKMSSEVLISSDIINQETSGVEKEIEQIINKPVYIQSVSCPGMPRYDCPVWRSIIKTNSYLEARKLKKKLDQEFPEYEIKISWYKTIMDFAKYGGNFNYNSPR